MKYLNNQKFLNLMLCGAFLSSVSTLNAMNVGENEKESPQHSTAPGKKEVEQTQQPIKKTIQLVSTNFNVNGKKITVSIHLCV
ncbi:hypothetical protein Bealeia1_00915 [Candidatus Bealeia paramacronuclearis]|uniref:Uncharacterized protein n=1 Tax=Candidatus Bealeia paramacronuclearis TaxID=1921001 RepID=A0ABZ2C3J5_9PROT|nr:hypothetical protein [Candidatus Bealeia paramacronuclearis]